MTDLQLALIGLGALIIGGVVLFNWWQERDMRRAAAKHFEAPRRDVLMEDERHDEFHIDHDAILRDEQAAPAPYTEAAPVQSLVQDPAPEPSPAQAELHDTTEAEAAAGHEWRDTTPQPAAWQEVAQPEPALSGIDNLEPPYQHYEAPLAPASAAYAEAAGTPDNNIADDSDTIQDSLPDEISHQIDITAVVYLPDATSGEALRQLLPALAELDKPLHAHGLGEDGYWHVLTREQDSTGFLRAAYSLQLADRSGPVSWDTLNRFQQAVEKLSQSLGGQVAWQGHPDPLQYAQALDQFCVEVDKMVGFHIVQGVSGPFTGTKLRGLAEASGMVLGSDGAFHFENDYGQRLFSLVNQDNNPLNPEMLRSVVLRGISFQLDIPRVKNCAEVFNQMVLAAKQMENSLSATLVDDHQRLLGEIQIEKIRQQLKVIHTQMVARGVVPGSPLALRLFS